MSPIYSRIPYDLSEILNDHSNSRNKISASYDCLNFPEGKFK